MESLCWLIAEHAPSDGTTSVRDYSLFVRSLLDFEFATTTTHW